MGKAFCINPNHPEFLELVEKSKLKPQIVLAKCSIYMSYNNTDKFPSLENLLWKTDLKLREKYFFDGDVQKVSTILNRIVASGTPLSILAEHLKKFVKDDFLIKLSETATIPYVNENNEESLAAGISLYQKGKENESVIVAEYASFKGSSEATILHEILHQLSQWELEYNKDSVFNKEFEALYNHAKNFFNIKDYDKLSKEDKGLFYGLKNKHEFLVALFTDANFIKKMSEVPPMKENGKFANLLQEVFNSLLKKLNININTPFYNQAYSVATNILEDAALKEQSRIDFENISNEELNPFADEDVTQFNLQTPVTTFDLLEELRDLGIVTKYKGYYLIKKGTDININLARFNEKNIEISKRLGLYPDLVYDIIKSRSGKSMNVVVKYNLLQDTMFKQQVHTRTKIDEDRLVDTLQHLKKIFPGIAVVTISREKLRTAFPNMSEEELDKIVAFYYHGKKRIAIANQNLMTVETLVEEFLHPFINSIEGSPLFNSLMAEAKNRAKELGSEFYNLYQKVKKNYAEVYENNERDIDKEFLTQAISIIYARQYNEKIDTPFSKLVKRFKERMLELLAKIGVDFKSIKDLKNLKISTLVELMQQEEFRWEIEDSNTPNERVWFNLQDRINFEVQKELESENIDILRQKYFSLHEKLINELKFARKESAILTNLSQTLEKEQDLISQEQIAQNMLTYFSSTSTYIRVLLEEINRSEIKKNNNLMSEDELSNLAFSAFRASSVLIGDLEEFSVQMSKLKGVGNNPIVNQVEQAISQANEIIRQFQKLSAAPVAKALAKELSLSEKDLQERIDADIKEQERILSMMVGDSRRKTKIIEKIKNLKKLKAFTASEENIMSHLTGLSRVVPGVGKIDTFNRVDYVKGENNEENFWDSLDARFLAGMSSGNATVVSVAMFIKNSIQEGIQNYIDNNRQKIQELKEYFLAQNPGLSIEDLEEAFKKFTGVFEKHYIDKQTGELVTGEKTQEVALLSENDHYAFNNDLIALKYKLSLESDPDKREEITKEIEKFIKDNAESIYTDEYEKIQNLLIPEAREAREKIFTQINKYNAIREANNNILDEEDLQELWDLYSDLNRLESVFDKDGVPKPANSKELRIAESLKAFKKARKDEDVVEYDITDKNKELWALQKKDIDEGYENGSVSQEDRDLWYKNNVKTTFTKDYYEELKYIWDDITRLLNLIPHDAESEQAKKDLEKYRSDLQDLSRGYQDINGFIKADSYLVKDGHMNEDLVAKVKELDEKLLEIKKYVTKYSGLTEIEKNELFSLKKEMSQTTDFDKKQKIKQRITFLEQKMEASGLTQDQTKKLLNNFNKLSELSASKDSPYYIDRRQLEIDKIKSENSELSEDEVNEELEKTDWFINNHIQKEVFIKHESDDGSYFFTTEIKPFPLSIWTKSFPIDEIYINEETPSNVWTTFKIASGLSEKEKTRLKFLKTTISTLTNAEDVKNAQEEIDKLEKKSKKNYFRPDSKTMNGRMKPKSSSTKYKNKAYENLSPKDKDFLEKYRALYYEAQELVPTSQRNADKLPGIEKHALDRGISNYITTSLPLFWVKLKAIFFKRARLDEDPDFIKKSKYLRMKFQGKVKADRISYNLFDSLGDYSVEANIFNRTFANQKTVLTAQHLITEKRKGTKAARQISDLVDMLMFNEYDSTKNETLKRIIGQNQKLSALLMLSVKPLNALKNASVGVLSSFISGNSPHYKIQDYRRALYKTKAIVFESVIHDVRNPAKKNILGLKIEKFNIIQGSLRDNIGKGFMNTITKGIFSREMLTKGRVMGEFLIQTSLAEAISQSTKVPLNGVPTPIMDMYEAVDNKLTLKQGAYTDAQGVKWSDEMIAAKEKQFMNIVEKYNIEVNGNYSKVNKGNIERTWGGKVLLFMQKYIPTFIKEKFGKESVDHVTGQIKIGTYRALLELCIDMALELRSFKTIYKEQTNYNKYRANMAIRESVIWGALSMLSWSLAMLLKGKDDDEPVTWAGWNILNLINQTNTELTTMNPFDTVHDYIPVTQSAKTKKYELATKEAYFTRLYKQAIIKRFSANYYVVENVLYPLMYDGFHYSVNGDSNYKGNKALYHKEYGSHKKGDIKFFADLQKLVPGYTGTQSIIHPKEATDAWIYMNSLH